MKKIIHLSDLHFGTETQGMLDILLTDIQNEKPDIIIISGDFTQRARKNQFQKAQNFINLLNKEALLCVPGNHDISLYNLLERFFYPLEKYKNYITTDLNPIYFNDGIAILGINSVTPFRSMRGTISKAQLDAISHFFQAQPRDSLKIVVMHHNLIRSERHNIITNAEDLIRTLAASHVNLILSGHLHYACFEQIKRPYFSYNMYTITAGTAVSRRLRQGQNSYNLIELDKDKFKLIVREYKDHRFTTLSETVFNL